MAKIINVEKSAFVDTVVKNYTDIKLGQYGKFLDKNMVFITYYPINEARSIADVGTGGHKDDLGPNSPIRYNKINKLPAFNIPVLNPDINYDETGFDVNLDISDLTLLYGTVKPKGGDYFIIEYPGVTNKWLFHVTNFRYNTIQSNDFYNIEAELKDIGATVESSIEPLVIEEYEVIYENIGTNEKCLIRSTDLQPIKDLAKLFIEMRDLYKSTYFDSRIGSFVLEENNYDPTSCYYDMYIEQFITKSEIFHTENSAETVALVNNDIISDSTNVNFSRTLLYAILKRDKSYLAPYIYYYQSPITRISSPFVVYNYNCMGTNLVISKEKVNSDASGLLQGGYWHEYFSNTLLDSIINGTDYTGDSYIETVILSFMKGEKLDIDRTKLIPYLLERNVYNYLHIPVILYIIMDYYDSYFNQDDL